VRRCAAGAPRSFTRSKKPCTTARATSTGLWGDEGGFAPRPAGRRGGRAVVIEAIEERPGYKAGKGNVRARRVDVASVRSCGTRAARRPTSSMGEGKERDGKGHGRLLQEALRSSFPSSLIRGPAHGLRRLGSGWVALDEGHRRSRAASWGTISSSRSTERIKTGIEKGAELTACSSR